MIAAGMPDTTGSPPRMRGKVSIGLGQPGTGRITPAYAGKRRNFCYAVSVQRDHPRICGEKPHGLPPLLGDVGITPAYAGKSCPSTGCILPCWDHPRICGEKSGVSRSFTAFTGSPPHMRGKGNAQLLSAVYERITPAYAGKSYCEYTNLGLSKDHPRICGEKPPAVAFLGSVSGSPPHMRGKAKDAINAVSAVRITPAYAGKRPRRSTWAQPCTDHPRICGEKKALGPFTSSSRGSPPHMRGKVHLLLTNGGLSRITPAYAGKSPSGRYCV